VESFAVNEFLALIAVILVDVALSLDNAVLISAVAEDVPEEQRSRVKLYGIVGAVIARIGCAFAAQLFLQYALFAVLGGAYLVKVAWDMLRHKQESDAPRKRDMFGPVMRIIIADVLMSFDNILAVAHSASGHRGIMAFGIALSIGLMFLATTLVSAALKRWPRSFYLAVTIVALTGVHMVWHGAFTLV
jgi:YjbE family integral membrane protein